MDKLTLLMKYLDGELTGHEKEEVNRMLENDPEARQLLKGIRSKKEMLLEQLRQLEPDPDILIPEWSDPEKTHSQQAKIFYKILRWAAILAVPVAVFLLVRYMNGPGEPNLSENGLPAEQEQEEILLIRSSSIDYAISPNRIWTKKQMVSTELITNSL